MADSPQGPTELTATERGDIEGMSMLLGAGTLYELLKVSADADRRTIRDAYFRLSKQFHPDAFYGRTLGPYGEQLDVIFRALTSAYDTLSNKNQRAEYDRSIGLDPSRALIPAVVSEPVLESQTGASEPRRTASATMSAVQPPAGPTRTASVTQPAVTIPRPSPSQVTAPMRPMEPIRPAPPVRPSDPVRPAQSTRPSDPVRPMEPVRPPTATRPAMSPNAATSGPATTVSRPAFAAPTEEAQRAAREALARKLAGNRSISQTTMPALQPGQVSAGASLHSQFANREDLARGSKLHQLRASATELAAKGDYVGASNTMQIVLGMAPEDPVIRQEALEIQRKLAEQLAPQHIEAAKEAERVRQYERAAMLWQKVLLARPDDVEANVRYGRALVSARKDLPRAAEAARKAIAIAPRRVDGHVLLAEVFEAAEKPVSARAAAEQAAKLDPTSRAVKDLLARLR